MTPTLCLFETFKTTLLELPAYSLIVGGLCFVAWLVAAFFGKLTGPPPPPLGRFIEYAPPPPATNPVPKTDLKTDTRTPQTDPQQAGQAPQTNGSTRA